MSDEVSLLVGLERAAKELGASVPTLRKWLPDIQAEWPNGGEECPVRKWGGNGNSYEIDVSLLRNWRTKVEAQAAEEERLRNEALAAQQSSLDLEGGEDKGVYLLPLNIRKQAAETVMAEMKAGTQRGDLVRKDEVVAEFEKMLSFFATNLRDLSNRLERKCNLDAATVTVVDTEVLEWQAQAARMLQADGYLNVENNTGNS